MKKLLATGIIILLALLGGGLFPPPPQENSNAANQPDTAPQDSPARAKSQAGGSASVENPAPSAESEAECDPQGVFASYTDHVHISCDETYLTVETETGLPDHEIMRGITAWILRVPIPFRYIGEHAWKIPLQPHWTESHLAAHARGPIAMAVNGVAIYHFDKRPDVVLDVDQPASPHHNNLLRLFL